MRRKVSKQGNVIEVTELQGCNTKCHAIKVDGGHWRDPETGEIHEYEKRGTSRTDNVQELRKSFAKLRATINTNCTNPGRLRWVTLTYREDMQDLKRLYTDFKAFAKRLRRKWGHCEYIAVPEPQRRGAWHMHVILIYEGRAPFIPSDELDVVWGHGFTKVSKLTNIDNVGAYLSAYLADMPAGEGEDGGNVVLKPTKGGETKRIVKGGRLHLYPVGMNIYRCSRGVKRPEEYWVETAEQVRELDRMDEELQPYVREYVVKADDGHEITVTKRWYNVKRPRKKGGGKTSPGVGPEPSRERPERALPARVPGRPDGPPALRGRHALGVGGVGSPEEGTKRAPGCPAPAWGLSETVAGVPAPGSRTRTTGGRLAASCGVRPEGTQGRAAHTSRAVRTGGACAGS